MYTSIKYSFTEIAFGMVMQGRQYNNASYRYGFNGMEKDDEIKGGGNSLDFEERIYDPRLGRFLSIDPMFNKYSEFSPYLFAANSPLLLIDYNGLYAEKPITVAQIRNKLDDGHKTKGYSVTIFVKQPIPGSNASHDGTEVGHTFISITKHNEDGTMTTAVFGWYPADEKNELLEGSPFNQKVKGTFNDDGGHGYDQKVAKYGVTEDQVKSILDNAEKYEKNKYDLEKCNCTSFALTVADELGVELPKTEAKIEMAGKNFKNGKGYTPGQLGQDINDNKVKPQNGVDITKKAGKAYNLTNTKNKEYKK